MPKHNESIQQEKEGRINALRQLLSNTDYIAIKASEGVISHKDYAEEKIQRQAWRCELEELESERSLDDLRRAKHIEINMACENIIVNGVEIGGKHYSLTIHDQIELFAQSSAIKEGAETVPYHTDGELCNQIPAAEFIAIATSATAHILYNRTYCNHLNRWIDRAGPQELEQIHYGAALPKDLAAHMTGILESSGRGSGGVANA